VVGAILPDKQSDILQSILAEHDTAMRWPAGWARRDCGLRFGTATVIIGAPVAHGNWHFCDDRSAAGIGG